MRILYFHELMGMTFPPVDINEEFAQGKFAENVIDGDQAHSICFTAVLRPYATTRKLLHILTPSSAAMTQTTLREGVKETPQMRAAVRYCVCPAASLTGETLNKLIKDCNPTHLLIDVDVLASEHKRLLYNRSVSQSLWKDGGRCEPLRGAPAFMKKAA